MLDLLNEAWQAVRRHPMRSGLSALGVAIALAAIVAVLAAEQSWQQTVEQGYARLGIKLLVVHGPPLDAKVARRALQVEDAEAIRRECPAATVVGEVLGPRPLDLKAGADHAPVTTYGVGPNYLRIRGWPTELRSGLRSPSPDGCWISPYSAKSLLGEDYRKRLPAEVTVEGRRVALNGLVLPPQYVDDAGEGYFLLPSRVDPKLFAGRQLSIEVWADDPRHAAQQINVLLSRRLGAKGVLPLSTGAWSFVEQMVAERSKLRLFTAVALLGILLVAVLGVVGTLLANLEERTRELALRRALGAQARRMAAEVFAESGLVCALGGLLGGALAFPTLWLAGQWLLRSPGLPFTGHLLALPFDIAQEMKVYLPWQALLAGWAACLGGALVAAAVPAALAARADVIPVLALAPSRRQVLHRALALAQLAAGVGAALLLFSLFAGLADYSLRQYRRVSRADTFTMVGFRNEKLTASGPGWVRYDGPPPEVFRKFCESRADLIALQERCRPFATVRRSAATSAMPVSRRRVSLTAEAIGLDDGVDAGRQAYPTDLLKGRGLTPAEGDAGARVCLLADDLARRLFGAEDPLGQPVLLHGLPFTVIGIVHTAFPGIPDAGHPPPPRHESLRVILPIRSVPPDWLGFPSLEVRLQGEPGRADVGYARVVAAVRDLARLPAGVTVHAIGEITRNRPLQKTARTLQVCSLLIGSAGFWVALVGLVNMLLAKAYARTRELGLLRALGATRGAVVRATLLESLCLSGVGALVGLAGAGGAAATLGRITSLPVALPPTWVGIVVAGVVLASALAALLPAAQAAAVDPAVALRHE